MMMTFIVRTKPLTYLLNKSSK